jgi:hypothetical protein
MTKSKDLDKINGKTPVIFMEIWVFPNLAGIFPFKILISPISTELQPFVVNC